MRKVCLDLVYQLARADQRVCFIGSDLGFGVLDDFRRGIPERFFMEGVSEANVIGMAAGLALEGNIPFVNTIATFLTRRAFEQIAVDLCLHRANVRLIGSGGGLVYAAQGPTHMAVEDLAIMCSLPNMTVVAPTDAVEMAAIMPQTLEWEGPIYIRLARGGEPVITANAPPFRFGKARLLRRGSDAIIVTTGAGAHIALAAAELLAARGYDSGVLHLPTVKPMDAEALIENCLGARAVLVVEEHNPWGGLATMVAQLLLEAGYGASGKFRRMGLPDAFPDDYGSQEQLLVRYGLTAEQAAAMVEALLA